MLLAQHRLFEAGLSQAFPSSQPPPRIQLRNRGGADLHEVCMFLQDRSWLSSIGFSNPLFTFSPGLWVEDVEPGVAAYYLPACLLFASFLMPSPSDLPAKWVEVLLIAVARPEEDVDLLQEELGCFVTASRTRPHAASLLSALNEAQRQSVAQFLNLYLLHRDVPMSGEGRQIFLEYVHRWESNPP